MSDSDQQTRMNRIGWGNRVTQIEAQRHVAQGPRLQWGGALGQLLGRHDSDTVTRIA